MPRRLAFLVLVSCFACGSRADQSDSIHQHDVPPPGGPSPALFGVDESVSSPGEARAALPAVLAAGAHTLRYEHKTGSGYDQNHAALASDIQALAAVGVGVNVQIDQQAVPATGGSSGQDDDWMTCDSSQSPDSCWSGYVAQYTATAAQLAADLQLAPNEYVLWNEPDMIAPLPPARLAALVASACPAIKQAAPGARVALGGFAFPTDTPYTQGKGRWEYMQEFWDALVATAQQGCLDVVNFHAYTDLHAAGEPVNAFVCGPALTSTNPGCTVNELPHTVAVIEQRMAGGNFVIGMDEWGLRDKGLGCASQDCDAILVEQVNGYFQAVAALPILEASFYAWGDPLAALMLRSYPGAQQAFLANAGWASSAPSW
jgi:hypothetical protein